MTDSKEVLEKEESHSVTPLEMVATGLSIVLVGLLIAVLIRDAVHPDPPARLTVSVAEPAVSGAQYRIPLTIRNDGGQSARDVVVHLELVAMPGDSVIAESDLTIDWLPRESSRNAVGLFARQSANVTVGARADVRAYIVP